MANCTLCGKPAGMFSKAHTACQSARQESLELLRRIGVVAPQRIRQVHLDYVMMGLILIAVGLAIPDLPTAIAVALVFGTLVNPFLFVPLAFDPDAEKRTWYRVLATI